MSGKRTSDGPTVKQTQQRPRRTRSRVLRVLRWLTLIGLVGVLVIVAGLVFLYKTTDIPDPNKDFQTETSFIYYNDGKTELGKFATQDRESIPLAQMPQTMKDAVVAIENQSFYTDSGIDPKGILRAAFSNASGNSTQGASTITQQYVKILYLSQERSYTRKIKEAILSLKVQRQQSKSAILEGYLNTIYFGRGAYGVQAAAAAYFDKPAKQLSLGESAVLASVLNNPAGFDPANGKDEKQALLGRYQQVLENMTAAGDITDSAATKAERRLPAFPKIAAQSTYGGQRGHMLELVRDELHARGYSDEQIDGEGLRVTTTFTEKAMDAAAAGVAEAKPEGFGDKQLHIAVASVEPGTGALRGFYGGQDYLQSQINWAAAGGMVGSTFKPFSLATALSNGFSLSDTFDGNSPYTFPDGLEVKNEGSGSDGLGNDYGAAVSATYALEQSINTAFVDLSNSIPDGPDKILATAERMGVPPVKADPKFPGVPGASVDLEADSLITLGKARISPINMANSFATVANRGQRADVHVIEKIVDRNGKELYADKPATTKAINEDVAADTSYAMQQVATVGTGAATQALGRPSAGKTGTATNGKDRVSSAWYVGFTPQLATAVMYVRGDGDNALDGFLPSYFGADYPADTWTAVMKRDMEGLDVVPLAKPAYVDGQAPTDGHAPYVPPPPVTTAAPAPPPPSSSSSQPTRQPSQSGSPQPSQSPTQTQSPTDPTSSASTQSPTCQVLNNCPTSTSSSSPSQSPSSPAPSSSPSSSPPSSTPPTASPSPTKPGNSGGAAP